MNTSEQARNDWIRDMSSAWKRDSICTCSPDGHCNCNAPRKGNLLPDGHTMHVPLSVSDSRPQPHEATDHIVACNYESNRRKIDQMKRDADRAQGFADHFTAQREQRERENAGPYADYCSELSDAWRSA